jgi:L,D-peptidoglycan transpeptidase YkuD (ErfK/YbiS/YcfS/YnhG family)
MIIINKSGYLKYKNLKFRCSLGKAGIGIKKREGDNLTPKGKFKLIQVFYRADRIKKIKTNLPKKIITRNMGWCDDSRSNNYNRLIKLPFNFSYERLYRRDNIYDLVVLINYNTKPIIKNKGSAIFIHISRKNFSPTRGCIALKKENLLQILSKVKKNTKIKIS